MALLASTSVIKGGCVEIGISLTLVPCRTCAVIWALICALCLRSVTTPPVKPYPIPTCQGCQTGLLLRSEEHTSELQSRPHLVCRLLLEKKKKNKNETNTINNNSTVI